MTSSRQPNVATAVARKWDVRCAINMGAGFVDLSTYRRPVTVSGAMGIRPAKGGLANKQSTSVPFVTVPTGLASGQGLTFVAVTNGNASSTPVGVSNTNNGNYGPALIITAGVPALKFRGSSGTIVSMTGPTIATGGDLAVACTWLPGVGIRGSFNGQEVVSAALADKTGNVLSSTLFFGNVTTVNTYFAAVIAGSVSDAELRQLSANPWQLCADPVLKTIYEQAASAGSSLAGSAVAIASASGLLSVAVPLAGLASAVSSASGVMTLSFPLSGAAQALAGATGALSVSGGSALSGSATVHVSASGAMSMSVRMSGAALAQAIAAGGMTISFPGGQMVSDPRYTVTRNAVGATVRHKAFDTLIAARSRNLTVHAN